jgi:hypothetical protein
LNKFSTVPLLMKAAREAVSQSSFDDVRKRLMVVDRCHVIRLNTVPEPGGQRVTDVVTERGTIPVSPDTKVIIALGTIESTRLALLSFGSDGRTGRNLIAHLRSNVDIRLPRAALATLPAMAKALEAAALFVKGRHEFKKPDGSSDGVRHFHFQITASGFSAGGADSEAELFKKIPDIDTFDAHKNATDTSIVITIRGIGEMEPKQDTDFGNSVTLDLNAQENDEFQTRRAFVNLQPSARDFEFWNVMDQAADDVAKYSPMDRRSTSSKNGQVIATSVDATSVKTILPYKFSDASGPGRRDGVGTTHHEAARFVSETTRTHPVTDSNCRFHQVTNAYVAAPALFPTIGSPNPMLTALPSCAGSVTTCCRSLLLQHRNPDLPTCSMEATHSFPIGKWPVAATFSRFGRILIAQQDARGIGLLFYKAQRFENFILRWTSCSASSRQQQRQLRRFYQIPRPAFARPGTDPVDPPNNAAFVPSIPGLKSRSMKKRAETSDSASPTVVSSPALERSTRSDS